MVRRAAPEDAAVLADIHITSWQSAYRGVFDEEYLAGLDRDTRAIWFEKRIAEDASILVEPDDGPQGFCWYGDPFATEPDDGWAELYAIYVHPAHWGEGNGYRLLNRAQDEMIRAGYSRVFLWVLDRNRQARAFYERQGWGLAKQLKLEEIGGNQITEVRYELDLSTLPRPERGLRGM